MLDRVGLKWEIFQTLIVQDKTVCEALLSDEILDGLEHQGLWWWHSSGPRSTDDWSFRLFKNHIRWEEHFRTWSWNEYLLFEAWRFVPALCLLDSENQIQFKTVVNKKYERKWIRISWINSHQFATSDSTPRPDHNI